MSLKHFGELLNRQSCICSAFMFEFKYLEIDHLHRQSYFKKNDTHDPLKDGSLHYTISLRSKIYNV